MSKQRFEHTGEAKSRCKAGAHVEIKIWQYGLAGLLAKTGVGRDELPDESLASARVYMAVAIDVRTRMPISIRVLQPTPRDS